MAEKRIQAYDARAERIGLVGVIVDTEEKPRLTMDGREMTDGDIASLDGWDRRLAQILLEDLLKDPLFDGERVYGSRAHFTASVHAREAGEEDAE